MQSATILALDPGGTTGVAHGYIRNGQFRFGSCGELDLEPHELYHMLKSISPNYLVAESFEYRNDPRPGAVLTSRNLLGVCELWASESGKHYSTQMPGDAMGKWPNPRLKKYGVYKYTVGSEHARDATRHLLTFVRFGKLGRSWPKDGTIA